MNREAVLCAERLNAEPPIFRGCTSTELGVIVLVAILIWLPLGFLLASLVNAVTMGMGIAALGVLASVFSVATLFQRIKRGRPEGYYQQRLVTWLHDRGLRRSRLIRRSGAWSIGRSR